MTIGDFQRGLLSLLAIALFALVAHIESACGQGNFFPAQSPMVNDLLPSVPAQHQFGNDPAAPLLPAPFPVQGALPPPAAASPPAMGQTADGTPRSVPILKYPPGEAPLTVQAQGQTVSIFARDVDLRLVLGHLAEASGVNIVVAESVQATVTTTLNDVPLWEALDAILKINGLVWSRQGEIIFVTRPGAGGDGGTNNSSPGLKLQVFDLNYTAADEVLEVINGLRSAAGKAFVHSVDSKDNRRSRERIVVEDYPERLEAIAGYLASVDNPPLQVLIEAHVLQVTLTDDQRHGVNLAGLLRLANGRVNVRTQGFANDAASPGFMLGLDSSDLDGMVEMLCSNSNVRTLAAPKVLVVNGQDARIQIGSRFGYFVTTTTQTSSLQSVNFLDIGVVLIVKPTITNDGQIMLTVAPKVSGGRINPDSGLPEEETTEAETTVLLPDGKGMIIGGLIKETDTANESWIPWIGKLPVVGRLFSRSSKNNQRTEVILALTPHIVPFQEHIICREQASYQAATNASGIITAGTGQPLSQ